MRAFVPSRFDVGHLVRALVGSRDTCTAGIEFWLLDMKEPT